MNQRKRNAALAFLVLGLIFLTIGLSTDNEIFSYIAIFFVLASMFLSRRPMRK